MKLIFCLTFIFSITIISIAQVNKFTDRYGIGIVTVDGIPKAGHRDKYEVIFYDTINEQAKPLFSRNFQYGEPNFYQKAEELNYQKFKFGSLYMICTKKKGDWFKVKIEGNKEYWIRNEKLTFNDYRNKKIVIDKYHFKSWEEQISEIVFVKRLNRKNNPIMSKPNRSSDTIIFNASECLTAIKGKGYWLKITPNNGEGCFGDGEPLFTIDYSKKYFKYGWVQWRNEDEFLIEVKYRSPQY